MAVQLASTRGGYMEINARLMRSRFLVRQGSIGWMVYDSELKGPAQIKKDGPFAENLTKEQAEILAKVLTNEPAETRKTGSCVRKSGPISPCS
ncbi:hypothetical protein H8B02_42330 [Bradyrhizobium sp. Pear77]|uniref:hypothetical protein n=1 Tax=Bradyrhizobium altum TaxID=1571202 RepID=UPI001E3BF89F|nr:hypothetical protein [Bradyrhizobium altum]MCC8959812.1 hypothetical protein [Bradyrhizobium altum]